MERKIVVKKMMNWFNILNDIDNLVLDKKFNVVVDNDVIIIKKIHIINSPNILMQIYLIFIIINLIQF